MQAEETQQLELVRIVPKQEPPKDYMTPEQRASFEEYCLKLRAEADEMREIAKWLYPDVEIGKYIPTYMLKAVRAEYNDRHGLPAPAWMNNEAVQPKTGPTKPKPFKPYKPWSKERKWRKHLADLNTRIKKKYSFPDLWIPVVQDELLKRPDYYGVCPLPGAVNACPVQLPDPKRLEAIERENQYRMIEAGLLQPVNLPTSIKLKPLELEPIGQPIEIQHKHINGG